MEQLTEMEAKAIELILGMPIIYTNYEISVLERDRSSIYGFITSIVASEPLISHLISADGKAITVGHPDLGSGVVFTIWRHRIKNAVNLEGFCTDIVNDIWPKDESAFDFETASLLGSG